MRHLRAIFAGVFLSALACVVLSERAQGQAKETLRMPSREQPPAYLRRIDIEGTMRGSPAVGQNGTIYVEAVSKVVYDTIFLNAVSPSGRTRWRARLPANTYPRRPPAIGLDGTIYVTGGDGFVYAFSPSGRLKRKFQVAAGPGIHYENPVVGPDGTLYLSIDHLCAFTPTGVLKWQTDSKWARENHADISNIFWSNLTVSANGTVYAVTGQYALAALSPAGKLKWTFKRPRWEFGGVDGDPAIGLNDTVYIRGTDAILYAVDGDGKILWSYQRENHDKTQRLNHDLDQPTCGPDGTIYFGSEGYFCALLPSGALKWETPSFSIVHYRPIVSKTGMIYVGGENGVIVAFDSNRQVKWHYKISDYSNCYLSPFLALTDDWSVCVEVNSSNGAEGGQHLYILQ